MADHHKKHQQAADTKRTLLKVGDKCPEVTLHVVGNDKHGRDVALLDTVHAHAATVLFFFPKAGTPVCTKEACEFNNARFEMDNKDVAVIGISPDPMDKLKAFGEQHNIGYMLASDSSPPCGVAAAFGVRPSGWFGLRPQERVTFVIDREGVVRLAYSAMFESVGHVSMAIQCVRQLIGQQSKE